MTTCETSISPYMYAVMATAVAVLIREYTRDDGSILITLPGISSICECAVRVAEMVPPNPEEVRP